MRKWIVLACAALFCCCGAPPDPSAYLRVDGQKIVDSAGNEIRLRTVGLGNWLLPEGYMWKFGRDGDRPRKIERLIAEMIGDDKAAVFWQQFRQYYITESDIARIKELGFNAVRPAMNWCLFMDEESGAIKKHGFVLIDNLVEWCKMHQVYIILDMHAAPGGQTGANIDDSANDFPELFAEKENQDRFIRLWVEMARRYRNEPIIIAYGLMNEPLPKEFAQFNEALEPLYQRTTAAIREVDPYHMISLEGAHWSTDFTVFGPPFDDNTFYQFHKYWSVADTKSIQPYLDFREQHNVPIYLGESGENNLSWYWLAYQLYEDHNIGWLFWPWKKMATRNTPYSIKEPEGWEKIAAYSRGGEKPSAPEAEAILSQFLQNIKLENCTYFDDVVSAIFRRVPARIEAENYGHLGDGNSYELQDTSHTAQHYRINEPVPIIKISEAEEHSRRDDAEYAVILKAGEGLNYEINTSIDRIMKVIVKIKANSEGPIIFMALDKKVTPMSQNYSREQWFFNQSSPMTVTRGRHDLKIMVDRGEVIVDWIEMR
ncbi:glycoside hydrolase family 5 protein [candidate division KSB1 bacterium]|nr:glycoside hydrolase family 5 protein [candidate division KSB1 bacterium]RQW05688.1 MAG: glycoside hydrolase family 5 protein [candidate division KSB1 bacterium]